MKTPAPSLQHATARGFTLVEVMVAMVIGMIGIIIMLQVFETAEGQRRSTTGTGDAQGNGAMALYTLQRDIRQAGFGFNALNVLGCPLTLPTQGNPPLEQLAPVVINPRTTDVPTGDANSDTLLITFGSGNGSPEGDIVTAVMGGQLGLQTASSFATGDRVIAGPSVPTVGCALTLAAVTAVTPPTITVQASGAVDGGTLFNLGQNPRILAYAVRAGNLTVCDYMVRDCGAACTGGDPTCGDQWVPIVNNIVALRAQYGRPSDPSPTSGVVPSGVDRWSQVTPTLACDPAYSGTGTPPPVDWARTSALRIVVVARNSQVDRGTLTGQAPPWAGSTTSLPDNPVPVPIDLGALINWQNYRYRTFETVIPIRNLPWITGC